MDEGMCMALHRCNYTLWKEKEKNLFVLLYEDTTKGRLSATDYVDPKQKWADWHLDLAIPPKHHGLVTQIVFWTTNLCCFVCVCGSPTQVTESRFCKALSIFSVFEVKFAGMIIKRSRWIKQVMMLGKWHWDSKHTSDLNDFVHCTGQLLNPD